MTGPAGTVGIGGPSSGEKLQVSGRIRAGTGQTGVSRALIVSDTGNEAALGLSAYGASGRNWNLAATDAASTGRLGQNPGSLMIYDGTADQTRVTIDLGGKVGIGTATPEETLDVAGNIQSAGLNKIVFLEPSVPGQNDDGTRINAEIEKLPPDGGVIVLRPGTYKINTTITNITFSGPRKGVKLRGFGGFAGTLAGQTQAPLTKLEWIGAAGGTVIHFRSIYDTEYFEDFEISDLTIDGRNTVTPGADADIGLLLDRIAFSKFINVYVQNLRNGTASPLSTGILLTTRQSATATTENVNCCFNLFLNCTVYGADQGMILRSEAPHKTATNERAFRISNTAHNTFVGFSVWFYGSSAAHVGIQLEDCDNNSFYRVWDCAISGGLKGYGVRIKRGSSTDQPYPLPSPVESAVLARSNYFYHLQAIGGIDPGPPPTPAPYGDGGSFIIEANANDKFRQKNLVFGYDLENLITQPESSPDKEVWKYLYWADSRGRTCGISAGLKRTDQTHPNDPLPLSLFVTTPAPALVETERMRIYTDGNAYIGSPPPTNNGYLLEVGGSFKANSLYGNGANLTGLNADALMSGLVSVGRGGTNNGSFGSNQVPYYVAANQRLEGSPNLTFDGSLLLAPDVISTREYSVRDTGGSTDRQALVGNSTTLFLGSAEYQKVAVQLQVGTEQFRVENDPTDAILIFVGGTFRRVKADNAIGQKRFLYVDV